MTTFTQYRVIQNKENELIPIKSCLIDLCDNDVLMVDRLRKEFYRKTPIRNGNYDRRIGVSNYLMVGIVHILEVSSLTGKLKNE